MNVLVGNIIGRIPRLIAVAVLLMATLSLPMSILSASPGEPPRPSSVILIAEAYQKGEIDYSTSVLYKVYSIFDPQKLPAEYQSTTPGKSATPILLEVKRNWQSLRPQIQDKLAPYLRIPMDKVTSFPPPFLRPILSGPESTYETTHFQIHYTTTGDDAVDLTDDNHNGVPDYIETMGTELENVWTTELSTMGWLQPPSDQSADGDPDYDVYVEDMTYYGYADPEALADQGTASGDNENSPAVTEHNAAYSYLALENDYTGFPNTPVYNIRVTAAHEFNHAIQFGYDVWEETWLMEATATWMEDEVYDDVNDNLQYLSDYFDNPDTCMPSETPGLHWYADWIFLRFISEHHGGQSTVRSIWENSVNYDSSTGSFAFNAIGDALSGVGTSLSSVFEEFTAANYVKSICPTNDPYCYEEAASYPDVYVEGTIDFSGTEVDYTPPDGVENYGADYIEIESTVDWIYISITGMVDTTTYAAQMVTLENNTAIVIPLHLTGTPPSGSLTIDTSSYDHVVLVVMNESVADEATCSDSGYNVTVREASTIEKGLSWLRDHQNPNGSWQNGVGITSMAALAFLNAGHTQDDPTVNGAIQYILANRHGDGSFGGTYETSATVWALVATHNPDYNDEISDAKDWLVNAQYDEGEGAAPSNPHYGGWRYGSSPSNGDLSNTQFALMALAAAGLPKDSATWTKAITFTSRCQNSSASNDQDWAKDENRPSYNDGGFIYDPTGWSLAGGSKSYGSMTSAGIWSLRLCGVDVTDGRVQAGLDWLANNEDCSFDDNPGHPYNQGHCFLYYYHMTIAKALSMSFLNELGGVDWYAGLSTKLADLQHDDGHWVNAYAAHGQENIAELATGYALLALQTQQPPAANLWMSIILASNADLCVYDPQGRHACLGDVTIPGATFEIDGEGRQIVNLRELEAGK